jgi:predicted short-subunit dehydrogenase-like oxidoreductase (DUF2520 family)
MTPTLGIIGAGRVGGALAQGLAAQGWAVVAVASRTPAHAAALAQAVGGRVCADATEVVRAAELTLLTVPDDAIAPIARQLAAHDLPAHALAHTSGALGVEALAPLEARGVRVGSLHPAFPFAGGHPELRGVAFAVEATDGGLRAQLLDLVAALGGEPLLIPPGGKAQYHAALCIASNYAVTLYSLAESLLTGLDIPRAAAEHTLNRLLAGTVDNLREQGVPDALTGPLVRADLGTLRLHLRALKGVDPDVAALYLALARHTLPLLTARGVPTDAIETLLKEEETHAFDRA